MNSTSSKNAPPFWSLSHYETPSTYLRRVGDTLIHNAVAEQKNTFNRPPARTSTPTVTLFAVTVTVAAAVAAEKAHTFLEASVQVGCSAIPNLFDGIHQAGLARFAEVSVLEHRLHLG